MKKSFGQGIVLALCAVLMTPVVGFAVFPMTPGMELSRPHDDKLLKGDLREDSSFKKFDNKRFFDRFDDDRFDRDFRFKDFRNFRDFKDDRKDDDR